MAFAGAVTIAPFAEAGYTYAMTHLEQIMIPIDLAIGYYDGNPPDITSGWQLIGYGISKFKDYLTKKWGQEMNLTLPKNTVLNINSKMVK